MSDSIHAPDDGSTMAFDPNHTPRPAGQIEIAAPLEEGSRIGPYEVREHIGDGGMAAVYKVWHTGLHRFEALKIPRYQASRGPEADFLHRLLAEARTAAGLHHPHIVAIHNVSDEKSILHYFAMEFVDGSDLAALIARGPLSFDDALTILRQIGSALDYAHANGVVHRDVKPANILLQSTDKGWHSRVVDFGISRAGEDNGHTRLTRSGMIVGTPEYMSPEQSGSGAAVDQRTDVYSLGIVAYEMLCGHPPFTAGDGVSRISVLMKQMNEPPMSLEHCRDDVPIGVCNAIHKALAKNPDERYASCAAFLQALEAVPIEESEPVNGPLSEARRRGTIAGMSAPSKASTLNNASNRRTHSGERRQITAAFEAPIPAAIVRAVTRPTSLLAGFAGLLIGAFAVWSLRQPPIENRTPIIAPQPTKAVISPMEATPAPKPTVTAAPRGIAAKPSAKPVVSAQPQPIAKSPIKTKRVRTAKKVLKPARRPVARRVAPQVKRAKPRFVRRPQPKRAMPRKTIVRISRPQPAHQTQRGGGEAPLPP